MTLYYTKPQRAFTLVEIIIATSLVALFTILPVFAYTSYLRISRDEQRKTELSQVQSALEQYKSQNQVYPQDLGDLVEEGFIPEIPIDPKDGTAVPGSETLTYGYQYSVDADGSTYTLFGILEQNNGEKYYRITPIGSQVAAIPVGGIVTNTPFPTNTTIPALTPSPTTEPAATVFTLDSEGDVGRGVDLSFGADGLPMLSYYDATNSNLIFLKCGDITCSSGNTRRVIETGSYGAAYSVERAYTSLRTGVGNNPIISYMVSTTQSYTYAYSCNDTTCSSGLASPLASGNTGAYVDMTIVANNRPVIVSNYTNMVINTNAIVSACPDPTCPSSVNTTISGYGNRGAYNAIVSGTGSEDTPFIAFYSISLGDLIGVKCTLAACTSSTGVTLDSTGDVGKYVAATLNSSGNPVISYYDNTNRTLKLIICPNAACTGATPVTLDNSNNGAHSSIAISADGTPVIAYMRLTEGDPEAPVLSSLMLLKCGNATCSSGNTITGLDEGALGMYATVRIAGDGKPVIAYYDYDNGNLKYIKCGTTSCQ